MGFNFKTGIPSPADKDSSPSFDNDRASFSYAGDALSLSTSTMSASTLPRGADTSSFTVGRRLRLHSLGQSLVSLPLAPRELEITITDSAGNKVYKSTRAKRSSNDSILSHIKQGELISTSYFLAPGRNPVIQMIQPFDVRHDIIRIETRWNSRATTFTLPNGRSFEWFYSRSKDADSGKKDRTTNVLVLCQITAECKKQQSRAKGTSQAIAKLIRTEETRTPGTTKYTAGGGGELVLDIDSTQFLDESIIVATCLVMLKREIDRWRGSQLG